MAVPKMVYLFSEHNIAKIYFGGNWDKVSGLLGGKGANLAEMERIGLPVPPGFTVTTEACNAYEREGKFPTGLWEEMMSSIKAIEIASGKVYGDPKNPLLVSCRSGAKFSMPGMMDTILNIGLNDETAKGMVALTNNERFVYDSYRRLIQMFGSVVLGIDDEAYEHPLDAAKIVKGVKNDTELSAEDMKKLVETFKEVTRKEHGSDFPQNPLDQLKLATEAVFKSWNGKRAVDYRRATNIPDDLGTAVNIVTMVFGNMGNDSGTGVAFTRNPSNGEKVLYGDYLLNAQGEDVVAGIRNTEKIQTLGRDLPEANERFLEIVKILEEHYRDMQDFEFTIEKGKIWILQTRNAKRTAIAALRVAVEMVAEGIINNIEAVKRVTPEMIDTVMKGTFEIRPKGTEEVFLPPSLDNLETTTQLLINYPPLARGISASPGVASGQIAFDSNRAEEWANSGKDVILLRPFTKPEDFYGILASRGILTSEGGSTCHAAVIARQFNKPCIVGAREVKIYIKHKKARIRETIVQEGDIITIDGSTGSIYIGKKEVIKKNSSESHIKQILEWADDISAGGLRRGLSVWVNADTSKDIQRGRNYGAKGIGLCRTEHMFFNPERLPTVQKMIISETGKDYRNSILELLPYLRADFEDIFFAADGIPVVIRLLDPPLYEFLPSYEQICEELATLRIQSPKRNRDNTENLKKKIVQLQETNPLLGFRGARLGICMPDIYKMQTRAIIEAACNVTTKSVKAMPRIMIPMVSNVGELDHLQKQLVNITQLVMREKDKNIDCRFGVTIETPRAALIAEELSKRNQFFSFGSNDLTQMVFGYCRDDAEKNYLEKYLDEGILIKNPFQIVDQEGVGVFMKIAVQEGRKSRPDLEIGVCGEHGGNPQSINFFDQIGIDYVSCSPFRVPVARLSAAQAWLEHNKTQKALSS